MRKTIYFRIERYLKINFRAPLRLLLRPFQKRRHAIIRIFIDYSIFIYKFFELSFVDKCRTYHMILFNVYFKNGFHRFHLNVVYFIVNSVRTTHTVRNNGKRI